VVSIPTTQRGGGKETPSGGVGQRGTNKNYEMRLERGPEGSGHTSPFLHKVRLVQKGKSKHGFIRHRAIGRKKTKDWSYKTPEKE